MKNFKNILLALVAATIVTACTEYERPDFTVEKPDKVAAVETLKSYDLLKTYTSTRNPKFMLGAGVSLSDFTAKSLRYRLVNSNFNEITLTGNDMLHGSIVTNDGSLNTTTIEPFITEAKDAGMNVFGGPLCWNENQNSLYLNGIIAPLVLEAENNLLNISVMKNKSFTGWENAGTITVKDDGGMAGFPGMVMTSTGTTPWILSLGSPKINVDPAKSYYLSFYMKVNKTGKIRIYFDKTNTNYPSDGLKDITTVDVWQRVYYQIPALKAGTSSFQFFIDFGYLNTVTYSVDITSFTVKEGIVDPNDVSQFVVKSPEEKAVIIDAALDKYISGMMKIGAPTVKSWNVVNKPMDDTNPAVLKTGVGKTLGANVFYWQDYLGEYYSARAIELARKYYTENGGNANDLTLFINESGLLNNAAKCTGLINYINKVETDKGVKVDGISTELQAIYGVTTIESIRELFTNLAASGKLVKISKFEMAYRAAGAAANTQASALTYDQKLELSTFYKEITKAYFELIPSNQSVGITYWSYLDNADSVGLWTIDYSRNFIYSGFADGLNGSDVH